MAHEYDNFKHFSSLTGVGVQIIALDATPIYETEAYSSYKEALDWLDSVIPGDLKAQTRASVVAGAMQSYRFGGRFFFYSPIGLFHFASPIITNGNHTMTAVGGPVLMLPLDEYISSELGNRLPIDCDWDELVRHLMPIPIVSPDIANTLSEQLLVNAKYLSDPEYLGIETGADRYNEYLLAYFTGAHSYEAILRLAAERKQRNADQRHENIIKAVKEYIGRNYASKIALIDVAKYVYISHSYLSKLIKIYTGHSFRHMINMARIEESVRLLENTNKNLSEIAYQTGFEDHSYFSKVFKRHTGMNPSEYRTGGRKSPDQAENI